MGKWCLAAIASRPSGAGVSEIPGRAPGRRVQVSGVAPLGPGVVTATTSCPAETMAASTGGEKMQRIPKKSTLTVVANGRNDGLTLVRPSSTVLDARYGNVFFRSRRPNRSDKMARMVNCVKLGRELPGLEKPPF